MHDPNDPQLHEDARNLFVVGVAAFVAIGVTGSLLLAPSPSHWTPPPPPTVTMSALEVGPPPPTLPDPSAGADRIWGTVTTEEGEEVTGYLRWNGREASWADLFHASEVGSTRLAGVRFGHVARLERIDTRVARVTLKGGDVVDLAALPRSRGEALRPLTVRSLAGGLRAIDWSGVRTVDFLPEPVEAAPPAERLHGTVLTRSGVGFTGFISWGGDDAFADAVLAGEPRGVAFADVAAVVRDTRAGAVRVELRSGQALRMSDAGNRRRGAAEVTVADPALGVAAVPWTDVREVRFHAPEDDVGYDRFDGGRPLLGTVTTANGEVLRGPLEWDTEEASTWQMLDGFLGDVAVHVDFGAIRSITKTGLGAKVELLDGRALELVGSNDVNWNNRGVVVFAQGGAREVEWEDFVQVRFAVGDAAGG